jgi:antitoxin MazE
MTPAQSQSVAHGLLCIYNVDTQRENVMEAVIRKWGNSPALRLPGAVMKSAAFDLDQHVIITATKGRIVIEPATQPEYKLEDLLAGMTDENAHDAMDFGGPVGQEAL